MTAKESWKTHLTSALYALSVPLGFLAGIEFSKNDTILFFILMGIVMFLEYIAGLMWMAAYKAEMRHARKTEGSDV